MTPTPSGMCRLIQVRRESKPLYSNSISHLNDFLVINPVHYEGELVGWTANLGHFTDLGYAINVFLDLGLLMSIHSSAVPGSMPSMTFH
jgi:hypothetical protein